MSHRLYIDESGDHSSSHQVDVGKRYLGLVGTIFLRTEYATFSLCLEAFKRTFLEDDPDDPAILHREDVVNKRGWYRILCNEQKRISFDAGLQDLILQSSFKIVAVVVDKFEHGKAEHRRIKHPYHYCLHAMLERYCRYLERVGATGDVMAESRGKTEDMALKEAYSRIWTHGTMYLNKSVAQATLTSREIKLKQKRATVAGLQLADVLAHPLTRDVLVAYGRIPARPDAYAAIVCKVAANKYNCHLSNGKIKGYGQILLA